jgi:2-octaprenyl-6-methoxyphenol hydroxylase
MLEAIGIAERLEGEGCPIRTIRVSDGLARRHRLRRPRGGDDPLGMMFENRRLRAGAARGALDAAKVTLLMPARRRRSSATAGVRVALEDGRAVAAPLLVGAEGRNSPTREAAGIPMARWSYDHARSSPPSSMSGTTSNAAYEIFYPTGPFAILPMLPGTRSAIVWSVPAAIRGA